MCGIIMHLSTTNKSNKNIKTIQLLQITENNVIRDFNNNVNLYIIRDIIILLVKCGK